MKKLLSLLAALITLAATPAHAQDGDTNYLQIGTLKTGDYNYHTGNMPFYTMDKYAQGITMYKAEAMDNITTGINITELAYFGYSSKSVSGTAKVYVATTDETTVAGFIKEGPKEGNSNTTVADTDRMTLFYDGPITINAEGSSSSAAQLITFTSDEGFTYDGGNLVVYISVSFPSGYSSASIFTANNGVKLRGSSALSRYRSSGYTQTGYSVDTKSWTDYTSYLPVLRIGYGGSRVAVTATVKGKVTSSHTRIGLEGATVKFDGQEMTTPSSGMYSFDIDDVDNKATYTLEISREGYDTYSQTLDIKAGGEFTHDVTLVKQPVPATFTPRITDKDSKQPVEGALITFDGMNGTSGADGRHMFNIANIDDMPTGGYPLSVSARGYYPYTTNITVASDLALDVEITRLPPLPGEGTLIGEYTIDNYDHLAPFNTLWSNSITESLYPAEALAGKVAEGEKIGAISYYGYVEAPQQSGGDNTGGDNTGGDTGDDYYYGYSLKADTDLPSYTYNVKIYAFSDDATQYPISGFAGADLENATPLYDGQITVPTAGSALFPVELFKAEFDTPYIYDGKGLRLVFVTDYSVTKIINFAHDATHTRNVLSKYASNEEGLQTASFSLVQKGLPVVRLGEYIPVGYVNGTVCDKLTHEPVNNAAVTLGIGLDALTATTDDSGAYSIKVRGITAESEYRLTVEAEGYNNYIDEVFFSDADTDGTVTCNPELEYQITVTGTVTAADGGELRELTVTLDGNEAEINADGSFTVTADPVEALTGKITANAAGYIPKEVTVDLTRGLAPAVAIVLDADPAHALTEISADNTTGLTIYNLQGIRITAPAKGEVYIVTDGMKSFKAILK